MTPSAGHVLPRLLAALAVCGVAGALLVTPVSAGGRRDYPLPAGSSVAGVAVEGLHPQEAAGRLQELWAEYRKVPWRVTLGEVQLKPTAGDLGLVPDFPRLVADLEATQTPPRTGLDHLERMLFAPPAVRLDLPLALDQAAFDAWVKGVRKQVDKPATDARVVWATKEILPESPGRTFDKQSLRAQLLQPLAALEGRSLKGAVTPVEPQVTRASLGQLDLSTPFATFTTEFDVKKASRSHNIAVAVAKWEGVAIAPDETISFNATVGQRTAKNGFKKAPVYENRRVSEGFGGGICQVSTTLYNTALLAGLEVVERGGHSRPCTYAPPGRDATVDWPGRDLKLKNPYDFPIYINAGVSGGSVTFTFYGDPTRAPSIKLEEEVKSLGGPGPATVIIDESLKPGTTIVVDKGFAGRKVTVTRIWNPGTAEEKREVISTDRTPALAGILRKNPHPAAPAGAPAEEVIQPEPTGDQDRPDFSF
ncbi:MAG TPA: VanW family protein [bacterium]|nr:VanW family protein [bacterium]